MTEQQLKKIVPFITNARIDRFYSYLIKYMIKYDINTIGRVAAFISQVAHESGSFRYTAEIASGLAYENRRDLGNIKFGDGKRFKGRGLIQITGRSNYTHISHSTGIDFLNNPTWLESDENAVMSACWWWKNNGLNELADEGDIKKISKRVNGGYNGLAERTKFYQTALKVLA